MRKMKYLLLCTPFYIVGCSGARALVGQTPRDPAATQRIPAFTVPAVKPGVTYERFIVVGDTGTGGPGQREVAATMAKRAQAERPDFILLTGDNIYDYGVKSAEDRQWKTKFEDIYAAPALQVPFYASLGNHDHYGNEQAQVDYARHNKLWNLPAFYYTFMRTLADGTKVQFFAIDTEPINKEQAGAADQLAWLDKELGKSDAKWKIVFGHHPLYGHNPARGHNRIMIEKIEPLLVKHKVDIYFAGHDHTLEMLKPVKGVHYVISGAGAAGDNAYRVEWTEESYYVATMGGFVLCRICGDELVLEFVRPDAGTEYAYTLSKSR
jgi:acid phosphatase